MPAPKLDDKRKRYVLQCLAEFKPDTFILNGLREKFETVLHDKAIGYYRRRFKGDIDRHRVEYLRDLASIELTHRKQRLLKLSEWLIHVEKGIPVYVKGPSGVKIVLRPDYGIGLRILDAIREEMKEARFEAGEGADGEEVLEWQLKIRRRFEQMQREAKEVDKKRVSPPTKGKEVGEGELVEGPVEGDEPTDPETDPETDPGTPTPPHEGEEG